MADEQKMLDELEALEKKATKGWQVSDSGRFVYALNVAGTNRFDFCVQPGRDNNGQITSGAELMANAALAAAARNALPTLLRLARRGLAAGEVVEEIAETCENLQRAAMLNVGDYIHVQGLRGGVEKIKAMADAALARLAEKEER